MFITIDIEPNDNCAENPMQVFQAEGEARKVIQVVVYEFGTPQLCWITGWGGSGSGSPCSAHYAPVVDSGAGTSFLVYGGDHGLRLKPTGLDEDWDINSPNQWGEPFLLLSDEEDILTEPRTQ